MDNMKRCSACGASIPADMRFCVRCGAKQLSAPPPVERSDSCIACGAALPHGVKFCVACGAPVSKPTPAVDAAPYTYSSPEIETQQAYTSVDTPPVAAEASTPTSTKKEKGKGSKGLILSIVIAALLLLCVVLCVLFFKDRAAPSPAPDTQGVPLSVSAVPLSQLIAYNIEYDFRFYDYAMDNKGNTYDNAIGGAVENEWNSVEYDLSGRYETISGRVILNHDYRDETTNYTCMKILLDDELIYTSPITTKGMSPTDFDLDISGGDTLCVSIYGGSYLRLVDCKLTPTELADNRMYFYSGKLSGFYPIAPEGAVASSELYSDGGVLYEAERTIDGDYTTSWQEDAAGLGIGESITLYYSQEVPVSLIKLRLGFAKKQTSYENNGKPSKLMIEFSDGAVFYPCFEEDNKDFYLALDHPIYTTYVSFTILDAYSGLKYEDTAITEISCYSHD